MNTQRSSQMCRHKGDTEGKKNTHNLIAGSEIYNNPTVRVFLFGTPEEALTLVLV